jgi:cellulose synthase/poly-beta-1,6-N-acetylglucosamine synthase-like glycosyltransferase
MANKRQQMLIGIQKATGEFIFFADDDVFWPPTVIDHLLAGFESAADVGVVGGFSRVRGQHTEATVARFNGWQVLAARRLSQYKLKCMASFRLDGGAPNISARTVAYRTAIVQEPAFQRGFADEAWLGKCKLNAGGGQFMVRWVLEHGWKARYQSAPEAEVESAAEPSANFIQQWLRWQRTAQRSHLKSLLFSKAVYRYVLSWLTSCGADVCTILTSPETPLSGVEIRRFPGHVGGRTSAHDLASLHRL